MHPGHGLTILEIQERLYRFLVDCCKAILHNIPEEELVSDKYPPQMAIEISPSNSDGFTSMVVMASEAPYRPPAFLDLIRLESLISARLFAAQDHIWALREDPTYFTDLVLETKDHRQEMMKDTNGKSHPVTQLSREDIFWQRIISNVLATAHMALEVWTELHNQVQNLCMLQIKHATSIKPTEDLPEEYLDAILRFRHYLKQAAKGPGG